MDRESGHGRGITGMLAPPMRSLVEVPCGSQIAATR